MTKLVFSELGYRRLSSSSILQEVLRHIEKTGMDSDVILDIRGCIFSYSLALILEAVVLKLNKYTDEKRLTIIHGYSTVTRNHLAPYLTKKISIFHDDSITTIDGIKSAMKTKYNIEFTIKGLSDE